MRGHMLMGRLGMLAAAAAAAAAPVDGTENTGGMPGKIPLGEF